MKIFQNNIEKCEQELLLLEHKLKRLSLVRLFTFLGAIILIIFLANERLTLALFVVCPICVIGFAALLSTYRRVVDQQKQTTLLKEINEKEELRQQNQLTDFPTGHAYAQSEHPYLADLDIFGSHSLFQTLNRTTSETGSDCLAKWLAEPATKTIILERQVAIAELTPQLEWRQKLQAAGLAFHNQKRDYQALLRWLEKREQLLPKKKRYLIGGIALSLSATALIVLYVASSFTEIFNFYLIPLIAVMVINRQLLKKVAPLAEETIDQTHHNVQTLGGYQHLAQLIISKDFATDRLKQLTSNLLPKDSSAVQEIKQLKKILESFQIRGTKRSIGNAFYGFFNACWLLDIYYLLSTEQWKYRNRARIQPWIEAISEFEVINSLAGFAYANPDYTFSEILDEPYTLQFENLGHPLIPAKQRVCNTFNLKGRGQMALITGSNMAGKSTFLRTVGVNLVLALMGAPSCATACRVSRMSLFTSMRTQDNLGEGVSSFYAELQRVEQLLKLIESGQPLLFMLDEIFKGTNSEDRYKGGVSLIKQMSELNAFGIISTHDLELAKLASNHSIVSNHSFNSEIKADEMHFNYTLTPGICTDFNASALMRKSGIKILDDLHLLQ